MEERTLDLRDVAKTYLEHNRWSIADMAQMIGLNRSTLSEWLAYKRDLKEANIQLVKSFLRGDYIKDISTIVNYMLLQQELEEESPHED